MVKTEDKLKDQNPYRNSISDNTGTKHCVCVWGGGGGGGGVVSCVIMTYSGCYMKTKTEVGSATALEIIVKCPQIDRMMDGPTVVCQYTTFEMRTF